MSEKIIGDGSHAAIRRHLSGGGPVRSEDLPSPLASSHAAIHRVAPSSRTMQRHERTGEPISSNNPQPRDVPVGQLDHPVEAHEAGPGSMDKPLKSGPAWASSERVLKANREQRLPGKNDTKDIGRGKPITY
jgi:hypothetical protein